MRLGEYYMNQAISCGCLHIGNVDPGFSTFSTAISICEIDLEQRSEDNPVGRIMSKAFIQ